MIFAMIRITMMNVIGMEEIVVVLVVTPYNIGIVMLVNV